MCRAHPGVVLTLLKDSVALEGFRTLVTQQLLHCSVAMSKNSCKCAIGIIIVGHQEDRGPFTC